MSKINQPKIPIDMIEPKDPSYKWKLVRESDGSVKISEAVTWIEWDEKGWFKQQYPFPAVGLSLLMSPFNQFFTWQTTPIVEILEMGNNLSHFKFKTKNNIYQLTQL